MERPVAAGAGAGRIYGVQRNMRQMSAVMLNAELADGWDPLLIEPYVTFMQRAGGYIFRGYQLSVPPYEVYDPGYPTSREAQPNARLLGLVNVSVVLSRTPLTDPRFGLVSYVDGTFIYWNQAAAGYAYLVAPGPEGSPPSINSLRRLDATLRMRERSAERLSFTITSSTGGFLVLGSPAFPGWTARLDGQPVPLATIEGVLPAVRLGPGTHQLTFAYAPRTVYWGTVLSLGGTLAGLVWMVGFPRIRMKDEL